MAGDPYKNIVKDEHMSDIAMAIREVLGPDSGLTILDFPDKIREIRNVLVDALCWKGECDDIHAEALINALDWR